MIWPDEVKVTGEMNEHPIWPYLAPHEARIKALSDRVWGTPETCYQENASMNRRTDIVIGLVR